MVAGIVDVSASASSSGLSVSLPPGTALVDRVGGASWASLAEMCDRGPNRSVSAHSPKMGFRTEQKSRGAVSVKICLLGYLSVWSGWVFHRVPQPTLGPYSPSYVAFLLVSASPVLLLWFVRRALLSLDPRDTRFALLAFAIALVGVYGAATVSYRFQRKHDFDPFLQMPPTEWRQTPRSAGGLRVLALGGSTTRGARLEIRDRYPRRLQEMLQLRFPDEVVEVHNAGMDWWTTRHSLSYYATEMAGVHFDVVVVMHGINDLVRSFSPPRFATGPYRDDWSHYYGPAINGARPKSLEGRLLEGPLRCWFSSLRVTEVDLPVEAYRSRPSFVKYLEGLVRVARSRKAEVVLVGQPSLFRMDLPARERSSLWMARSLMEIRKGVLRREHPSAASLAEAMAAFSLSVQTTALANGAVWVDGAASLPKDRRYFIDGVHHTPLGADRLAAGVAPLLEERVRHQRDQQVATRVLAPPPSSSSAHP